MLRLPSLSPGAAMVACLAWMCHPSAAEEIACDQSRVAFDAKAYPKGAEISCARGEVGASATDPDMVKLRKEHPDTWQYMTAFQAFSPENTTVDSADMSSNLGKYGSSYFAAAKPNTTMPEPNLRKAIEAIASFNLFSDEPSKITWQGEERVGDYTVLFYLMVYPDTGFGGGPRECLAYARYLDGTAAHHTKRVTGTYCEVSIDPLDAKDAKAVLQTLIVRPRESCPASAACGRRLIVAGNGACGPGNWRVIPNRNDA